MPQQCQVEISEEDFQILREEYGNRTGDDDHLINETDSIILSRVLHATAERVKKKNIMR